MKSSLHHIPSSSISVLNCDLKEVDECALVHFFFISASWGTALPLHFKFASYAYEQGLCPATCWPTLTLKTLPGLSHVSHYTLYTFIQRVSVLSLRLMSPCHMTNRGGGGGHRCSTSTEGRFTQSRPIGHVTKVCEPISVTGNHLDQFCLPKYSSFAQAESNSLDGSGDN